MYYREEQLNKAIESLRKGASLAHVLETLPDQEMRDLVTLSHMGMTIPTKTVPSPARQYKFMSVATEPTRLWLRVLPFMRMAVMPLSLLLVLLGGLVGKFAVDSTAGDRFFVVKHAYEQLQIHIAQSPEARAQLQLSFAQRRIADAETVFSQSNSNPGAKEAALIEVANQSKTTLESVKQVQGEDAAVPASIVEQLTKIADQQQQLITNTAVASNTPAQNTKDSLSKGGEMVATAHEETLAALTSPDSVKLLTFSDTITIAKDKTITLGKDTAINFGDNTVIKQGVDVVKADKLIVGAKVSVKATKDDDGKLQATEIIIVEEAKITKPTLKPVVKPADTVKLPDPNTATAGFIPETPTPQYAP